MRTPQDGTSTASNAQPGSRLRRKTCNDLGAYQLPRNQFHGPGIDLVQTALDLAVPGGLNLRSRCVIPLLLKQALNEPVHLAERQLAGIFEDFLGAAAHGEIVARNRPQNQYLTGWLGSPGFKPTRPQCGHRGRDCGQPPGRSVPVRPSWWRTGWDRWTGGRRRGVFPGGREPRP